MLGGSGLSVSCAFPTTLMPLELLSISLTSGGVAFLSCFVVKKKKLYFKKVSLSALVSLFRIGRFWLSLVLLGHPGPRAHLATPGGSCLVILTICN
jgi:hypothetical protein